LWVPRGNHALLALLFHGGRVLPVTTVTIFRYAAKRHATQRNVSDEYSVEISGVSDLSFLFAMRFGAEVNNPPLSASSFAINPIALNQHSRLIPFTEGRTIEM
jgi:hypothetical protein